jgi:hypothetical protein
MVAFYRAMVAGESLTVDRDGDNVSACPQAL